MKKLIEYMRKHIKIARGLVMLCMALLTCCVFPIRLGEFPLGWLQFFALIGCCRAVAEGFAGVYGPGRVGWVWLMAVASTALGLLGRYLLEFGEVSNTYNFTPVNLVVFLLAVPLGTVAAYYSSCKKRKGEKI